jgi:fructose-1,6-bisphosphatase
MFKNGEYDQQVLINASNEIKSKIRALYEEEYEPL